ncbi:MAG: CoA ester lyase, partial [Pseudomonadota bacterium]
MRSLLFVPGDSERKLAKSLGVGADALIFDLEDSIGPDRKGIARTMVAEFLRAPDVRAAPVMFWVRINAFDTAHWEDDLTTVMAAAPDGIMLPKSTSGDDVASLSVALGKLETRFGLRHGQTQILPIATEVPISLLRMETYVGISPRMTVFSWGCEDLSAELGAMSSRDPAGRLTSPFRLARDLCLMTAVASGAQPVDTVFVNFRDNSGLETECDEAVRDG